MRSVSGKQDVALEQSQQHTRAPARNSPTLNIVGGAGVASHSAQQVTTETGDQDVRGSGPLHPRSSGLHNACLQIGPESLLANWLLDSNR